MASSVRTIVCTNTRTITNNLFFSSVTGILKGFDPLLNLVLDGTTEFQRGKAISLLHNLFHKYIAQ